MATAPNQTWSWDITKLLGPTKWTYFHLYVVLDIFSRYAVGWMVADRENSALAGRLIEETCHKQGVQPRVLTLHSDRGAPMTSKCTAQLLADLGVTRSLSRPQVSDDNPFSEAQFKTLKYHPGFPGRFHDINAANAFCRTFFPWYNTEHRHGRIAMLTPDDVHHHRTRSVLDQRGRTLQAAWTRHPERFVRGVPKPDSLPEAVWIQPTRDIQNRRDCSVNRDRQCLKVVDRFRTPLRVESRSMSPSLHCQHRTQLAREYCPSSVDMVLGAPAPLQSVLDHRAEGGVTPGLGVVPELQAEDPGLPLHARPRERAHGIGPVRRQQHVAVVFTVANRVGLVFDLEVGQARQRADDRY